MSNYDSLNYAGLKQKWQPILEAPEAPTLNAYKENVMAVLLENTERALQEERRQYQFLTEAPTNSTGAAINNWDPILISMVRRTMPNLIAYDLASVQPMTGPTGLIFCLKSRYKTNDDRLQSQEAFYNEPKTDWSSSSLDVTGAQPVQNPKSGTHSGDPSSIPGTGSAVDSDPLDGLADDFGFGTAMSTAEGEALGNEASNSFSEMSFTIERATVTARTRGLKSEYTMEMAQDLKAIHGLDAEAELANMLSAEILAEINREFIRTITSRAKLGCQQPDLSAPGVFNLDADADGRWSAEKYKGLLVQVAREQNVIAKETRRGKGNWVLCSSDVAAALSATGMLDYSPALTANASLNIDDTGNTFVGVLSSGVRIYIDPYANMDYLCVGYKGSNPYDSGIFYAPLSPLTMVRAVGENSFQPKIAFKTRYGMIANPFAGSSLGLSAPHDNIGPPRSNEYFRIFAVKGILGGTSGITAP